MADATFDPSEHTVAEVQDYLAEHPEDAARVRDLEAQGKDRQGVQAAVSVAQEAPVLPEGAEPVSEAPSGLWHRLVGEDGEPVTVNGQDVALKR